MERCYRASSTCPTSPRAATRTPAALRAAPSRTTTSGAGRRASRVSFPRRWSPVRIAAVADLHCTKASAGALQPAFAALAERADVLVLCGDLTDYGLPEEARVLA